MKRLILSILICVIAVSLVSCAVPQEDSNTDSNSNTTVTATQKPVETTVQSNSVNGELAELKSETLDGDKFVASSFGEHKITVINVWATWCQPCIEELKSLEKLRNNYSEKGVNVIGILFDSDDDGAIFQAKSILQDKGVTYTQIISSESVKTLLVESYDLQSLPTTFFVDSNGDIIKQAVGSNSYDGWRKTVDGILG